MVLVLFVLVTALAIRHHRKQDEENFRRITSEIWALGARYETDPDKRASPEKIVALTFSGLDGSEDLSFLSELNSLSRIRFSGCQLEREQFDNESERMHSIRELYLHDTPLSPETASVLAGWQGIEEVEISNCEMDPQIFSMLLEQPITKLNLREVQLLGPIAEDLAQSKSLDELILSEVNLSNEDLISIAESAPNLSWLAIHMCERISDIGVQAFCHSKKLAALVLITVPVKGDFLEKFEGNEKLLMLRLDGINIHEAALAKLHTLSSLEYLSLGSSSITDSELASMPVPDRVRYLSISDTKISEKAIPSLKQWPALEFVSAFGLSFEEEIEKEWPSDGLYEYSLQLQARMESGH